MHSATYKLLAAGVAGIGLALGGFGLFALTAADPPAPATPPTVQPGAAAPPAARAAQKSWVEKHTLTHKSAITAVAVGPDVVAVGDKDGVLVLWDAKTGKQKETLLDGKADAGKPVDHLQVSPDGVWLYLVTNKGDCIHQCSVVKENRLFPGIGGNGVFTSYGVTTDGKFWLQAFNNRNLQLLENTFDQNIAPSKGIGLFVHKDKIDFAAAGEADVVATVAAGTLRRWDKAQRKPIWEEKLDTFEVAALAVCPLTKVIAVGGKNGEVRIYGALTGKVLTTLTGHNAPVRAIAFNADGTRIVTGSADKTARLWDAEEGKELAVLKGHTEPVTAVAFSPDGEMLTTGSADKSVRVWASPAK
jgi:WD40 repeat protein